MSPRSGRLPRLLARLAYAGALLLCFGVAAYLAFNLFVKSGVTQAPELTGLPLAEAQALLRDQGLVGRLADGRFDPEVPAGAVARQDPSPRTLVKRGSEMELVPSLGPEQLQVPDLRGKSLASAQVTLSAAGLSLGRTLSVFDPTEPGTVVRQRPEPGQAASPDAAVDVLLSSGSSAGKFLMPDLVYRDYDQARRFFENRGFRFGSVKFESYEGARPGAILRQFPLPGHPVSPDDAISLVVAASPDTLAAEPRDAA